MKLVSQKNKIKNKKPTAPVFSSVDEYYDFCRKHGVYGGQAKELKKSMDKLDRSLQKKMLPNIKPPQDDKPQQAKLVFDKDGNFTYV